ncbi:MAG: PolC-type DNA polymerase III [Erysipelotrichaceae bacterium]|nr:PolC-type DNA polymerase III [Erysipelotrichaceae bacterium]
MNFDIRYFIDEFRYTDDKAAFLADFRIVDVLYRRSLDFAYIKAENAKVLPYGIYMDLISYFHKHGLNNLKLYIKAKDQDLPIKEINLYLESYAHDHDTFRTCVPLLGEDGFILSYTDKEEYDRDQDDLDELKLYFYDLGYRRQISMQYKEIDRNPIIEEKAAIVKPQPKVEEKTTPQQNNYYHNRKKEYTETTLEHLEDGMTNMKCRGKIFKVDERKTRTGITIQTLYVKDETDAIVVKVVENKRFTAEILKKNKEGQCAYFYGNYHFDPYARDLLFEPDQIEFIDDFDVLIDDADEKRVELHAHTKLSEMDGVSSPKELVNGAFAMGHRAVAITDHLCLQGFHEAYGAYKDIRKKNPDADFKVLYGCEMNMVSPYLNIVYNVNDDNLKDVEYIVFDLETTGLSTRYDYIIEFGAVLMRRGTVVEQKDFFVKPPIAMSEATKKMTHISESDLQGARTFAECKDEILDFIKGRVLVAHNASFDFGFLNSELERIGEKPLSNPVIDTLDLSRSLLKNRRYHSLGSLCRAYNIPYDENIAHRANYDADVLAQSFNLMLKDVGEKGVGTLRQLAAFQGDDAFVRNRAFHTTVLCRDQKGLKDLFKLISISNTDTLAIFGKANTKDENSEFIAEPRIFKETLEKYREHLLIGSACLNGEIFEIASTRSKEELAKAISFYDYIEVQPLENYRFLYELREQFTKERLMQYLRDIIEEAQRQNKIVVATGDVHYVRKDEKIIRDVYINAIPIHGGHHPLYIFDKEKRKNIPTPDQRLLNTKEMLEAFAWLNDEKLIRELVITNTNRVADLCENVKPFSDDLSPPKINDAIAVARRCNIDEEPFCGRNEVINADEYLREYVYYNAHQIYGDQLDETIEKRLETELNNIISHGYGVIYFVCHLLIQRSNDDGYLVGSRGSVGSSLVATMSNITEVNPLAPHYICPHCHKLIWMKDVASGYDLPDKVCPDCGSLMNGDGQNIPFETFLGFDGDKIPDIDLNFSGDYQPKAHLFTREIFGPENVFRAGTISTVAEKTAFGYVTGYCEEKEITTMSRAQRQRLASGCEGVKRTTGQHAGGIVVLPDDMEIEDVTPIQYPANDPDAAWRSTHFEYHDFSDNLLKFDLLGHVDPTAMRLFENISGIDVKTIPMNDEKVLSLFYSPKALNIINPNYHEETGAAGLPEFGTLNTRGTIEETRPHLFSELVQISGLSHGTDVWRGNAQELIKNGIRLSDVIGCRDDIMTTLLGYELEPLDAFNIMEHVRKGKSLTESEETLLLNHNVPKWYIESCKKIKYMFPKAHAVAYCIMAVRVAWFKVHHPEYYYVSFFTLRCDAYEIETMIKDADLIYARMQELLTKMNNKEASKKERDIFDTLEVCYEMVSRGYRMTNIDLNRSLATEFLVDPEDHHKIIPPFKILDGLGDNVAESIVSAREKQEFLSKEDLQDRTLLSQTLIKKLDALGVLNHLDDTNQMRLFDF